MFDYAEIILALIQGITEIIPVSSTAHLSLFTISVFVDSLTIISIAWASVLAILFVFRREIVEEWRHLIIPSIFATLPVMLVGGVLFFLDIPFRDVNYLPIALVIGSFFMASGEALSRYKRNHNSKYPTIIQSIIFGIFQSFAAVPGASRLGMTTASLMLLGFARKKALELSFILGTPSLALLAVFEIVNNYNDIYIDSGILFDATLSFIIVFLIISLLLKKAIDLMDRFTLYPIILYRIILAFILVLILI